MDGKNATILCQNCNAKIMFFNIFKNITPDKNNFIYFVNGDQYTITIPQGSYEISYLNKEIRRLMKENEHEDAIEIIPNISTYHCVLKIKANYAVQFSKKSKTFHKILGFKEGIYSAMHSNLHEVSYISQDFINITGK